MVVSLATALPGKPASCVSGQMVRGERIVTVVMSSCAAFEWSTQKGKEEGFFWVLKKTVSSGGHDVVSFLM